MMYADGNGIRLAPAQHYDLAAQSLHDARHSDNPAEMIRTHSYLDALTECLLGLLRAEMLRLDAGR